MEFLVVFNQKAGQANQNKLNQIIKIIENKGSSVKLLSLTDDGFKSELLGSLKDLKGLITFGGDGTLNTIVNVILSSTSLSPDELPTIVPYPSGTANDFAYQLFEQEVSIEEMINSVFQENIKFLDVGRVNDYYFINVFGIGSFADISYKTPPELKQRLGMWAYWVEAIKQLPNFGSINFSLKDTTKIETTQGYLLLVLNGKGAGGFKSLAPRSSLSDGKLDIVIVKENKTILDLAPLLPKIIRGEHLEDHRITYFQKDSIEITSDKEVVSVVDGEKGPTLPIKIDILPKRLPFAYQKQKEQEIKGLF
ncbi:diacylglycerol/lipid kinase family protein [Natranaerobius trueperi]|uniref:DAGKc domain-containing protein n=1 Tax=Natranaerobius trueperi TaxID=759412 RepID=A0A226C0T0_9FIRM|nr:diacylglycerol kinase family protein [Natranaerobius trueperi]OWZ84771.1 hypothetical protein CDO51_01765 [Natranaerobius trueperi]